MAFPSSHAPCIFACMTSYSSISDHGSHETDRSIFCFLLEYFLVFFLRSVSISSEVLYSTYVKYKTRRVEVWRPSLSCHVHTYFRFVYVDRVSNDPLFCLFFDFLKFPPASSHPNMVHSVHQSTLCAPCAFDWRKGARFRPATGGSIAKGPRLHLDEVKNCRKGVRERREKNQGCPHPSALLITPLYFLRYLVFFLTSYPSCLDYQSDDQPRTEGRKKSTKINLGRIRWGFASNASRQPG